VCHAQDLTQFIASVWYDSNGAHAEIEPSVMFNALPEGIRQIVAQIIREVAAETLSISVFLGVWTWGLKDRQRKTLNPYMKSLPVIQLSALTH
jgi:hypothetical protein